MATLVSPLEEVTVSCPSCDRQMSFSNDSWQCLACHPIPMNIPTCATQKCKRPLTKLGEPWNCYICLKCNKHPQEVNKLQKEAEEKKRVYLDKKVTPEDVQEMVAAAVAEALAKLKPDYPPTEAEIQTMTAPETINAVSQPPAIKPETYLQKAKRLGVKTHDTGEGGTGGMRKKAEIMTDIEKVEQPTEQQLLTNIEKVDKEESIEEADEFRKKAQTPPANDDEFARGMTEKDMM